MNRRQAKKIVRLAHPSRYDHRTVWKAIRVYRKALRREPWRRGCDCPANPSCPRFNVCNEEGWLDVLAMAIAHGRYPWGSWRCLMQQATGEGAEIGPGTWPFAVLQHGVPVEQAAERLGRPLTLGDFKAAVAKMARPADVGDLAALKLANTMLATEVSNG